MIAASLLACALADGPPQRTRQPRAEPPPLLTLDAQMAAQPNFLVLMLDDIGVDQVATWERSDSATPTPELDALAARGLRFDRAYASATCSPARSALLTGRSARRTGVGSIVRVLQDRVDLPTEAWTLAEMLVARGYDTAAVGKWHLSARSTALGGRWLGDPAEQGFRRFRGTMGNLTDGAGLLPGQGYYLFEQVDDAELWSRSGYATTHQVDDAVSTLSDLREPWFLYFAPNAAHDPFDLPPTGLASTTASPGTRGAYQAIIRALDMEIGRLMDALSPAVAARTHIVLLSDNGSPKSVIVEPFDHRRGKATLYDGGTQVPLLWAGPGVVQGTTDALAHATDIVPTVLALLGEDPSTPQVGPDGPVSFDGVDLSPVLRDPAAEVRTYVFTSLHWPNGDPADANIVEDAVRSDDFKLIRRADGSEAVFAYVEGAVDEGPELDASAMTSAQVAGTDALRAALSAHLSETVYEGR